MSEDFEGGLPATWSVVNYGTGNAWTVASGTAASGSNTLNYAYSTTDAANVYAFSSGISMVSGKQYELRFFHRVESSSYPENYRVTIGTSQANSGNTDTLYDFNGYTSASYAQAKDSIYTCTSTGTYYFGFHCYSGANEWDVYIDSVEVFEYNADDASLSALTSPSGAICSAGDSVRVDLTNAGVNSLTSVTINWSVNGTAQTAKSWTGTLAPGASESVNLGYYAYGAASTYNFEIATTNPNSTTDPNLTNDTLNVSLSQGLSGDYTVGGTGTPDYATITSAISALQSGGLCGDVRLLVYEGTYSGQYSLTNMPGLGAGATLEIVSHPSNTNLPVFTYAATGSTDNYVFEMNDVSYVILDSLEILPTGTTYARGVSFANNTNNITISNSKIRGNPTTTNSNLRALIYCNTTSSLDENITIENNTLLNGAYGIHLYGGSSAVEGGNKVLNNTIDSFYYYGIYTFYQQDIEISGNFVRDANTATSPRGLYCLYNFSANITKNTVMLGGTSAPNGMYLDYNDGTAANPTYITNNMISMYNTATAALGTVTGMEVYAAENNYVANNTIAVYGGSTSSRALYLYASLAGDTIKSYNNALANFGGGYSLYATTANSGIVANDNNAYYSSGSNLAYWGSARATLSDLQTANSLDASSLEFTPVFTSSMDLHTTAADLDASAQVLSYVTEDIDGDTRNITTPDIGADEFTPPPVDAGITAMVGSAFCAGTINTDVELFNFATDTLKTVNIVREVSVNGAAFTALDTLAWTGLLPTGESATVSLGTYIIGADSYVFKYYTYKPNTFNDPNNANDTLTTNTILASMEGTYTVGGVSADYATFAAVSADLAAKGMCDAVILEVNEGTYTEQVYVSAINGLSATNTLSVVSAPGNTTMPVLTYGASAAADNYVIQFENASYVSVDGLEIRATGATYANVIEFNQSNSNISLTNNKIVGLSNPTTTSTNIATIYFNSNGVNNNLTFDKNEIYNGSYGFYAYGTSTNRGYSNKFTDNTIDSFYYRGIYSYYQDSSVITGNFIRDNNNYTSPTGIYALYNTPMEITNNEVYIGGSSAPNGMYLDYNDGTPTEPVVISNNMISMYSTSASGTVTGMEVYNAENNIVAHNSIAVYGGSTSGRALYLFASGAGDSTYAYNNALANFGAGYALYAGTSTAVKACDYNNIYATGANIAYWSSSAQATLADLQTASGFDANSVSANPVFKSSMDLHAKGVGMNDLGTSLAYVTEDIDGDVRSATPDMGADEYTPPANDMAVVEILNEVDRCAVTSQELRAVITNFGTTTQSAYDLTLNITGAVTQTITATGGTTLPTGALDTISIGTFSTAVGGTFNFTVYNTLTGDEDLSNDTTSLNGIKVDALPAAPTVSDVDVCIADAGSVSLEATGSAVSYVWFATDTSTMSLSTDAIYTASLTSTDTFYVRGDYATSYSVGPADNSFGGGGNYTALQDGLVFNVANPITLDSVTVYPNGAGNVLVNIEDASGTTIFTTTVAVSGSGAQRIAVGASIPAGTGYEINALGSTTGGLYRNSGSASMPYSDAGNNVTITNTINNLSGFYYFWYDWAITAGGCSSPLARVIVNVNETAEPIIANDTICQGEDVSLNITSLTNQVTWYDDAAATAPIAYGSSYVATNVDSTTSYYITDLGANGCTSLVKEVKVVVKATPDAPVTADTAICTGESVMLSAMGTTGTINWYNTANGGSAITMGNSFATPNLNSTKVYYVSEMIDGCEGPREDVIVSVNAKPNAPAVNAVSALCASESATLMATSGANVMWYNTVALDATVGSGNSFATGTLMANDTFYAVDMFNGCSSEATEVVVMVNEVPMAPMATTDTVCAGNTATVSATSTGTNTWYTADDMMVFTGDMFTTPVLNETTSYYVSAGNGTCESNKTWVTVVVNPNVDADKAIAICEGDEAALSLTEGMMYNWYADNTTETVLAMGSMYTANLSATDTFYAQAVGGNCTDTRTQYIVTVNEAATLFVVSGSAICEGETAELTATAVGDVSWYATPSSATALSTGATFTTPVLNGTSIYYAQATNGACMSDRLPVIITVNPAPSADFVAEDHGNRVFVSATQTNSGYSHTWEIGDTTIIGGATAYVDGNTVGTVTVTHTIVNTITGCTSTSTADVTVGTASVAELATGKVGLYPNPNTGSFFVDVPKQNQVYTLRMLNIAGQEVYSTNELTAEVNAVNVTVPAGMYFVEISDGETTSTVKIVVR